MAFFFTCFVSTWVGRKIGWSLSRQFLYTSGWPVCILLCFGWASGVAYGLHVLILATHPGLLLKIYGYGAGMYVSVPNFGLVNENSIPAYGRARHDFLRGVPSLMFIVASVAFAFAG
jgi:hypothetical protein